MSRIQTIPLIRGEIREPVSAELVHLCDKHVEDFDQFWQPLLVEFGKPDAGLSREFNNAEPPAKTTMSATPSSTRSCLILNIERSANIRRLMMSKPDLDQLPPSGNFMDLLQDETWMNAALDAEDLVEGCVMANGLQKRGWMKTWPELPTYSHYMQMRSLILRGFDAILRDSDLGVGYQAASECGKNLVFERFFEPNDTVKAKLLTLIDGEKLGPRVELTPERSAVIRYALQEVLTAEDWEKIAQAAANQVQRQIMDLRVA